MILNKIFLLCTIFALLAAVTGCEKPHRAANVENLELTAELFTSIEQQDTRTAVRRAERLRLLAGESAGLAELIAHLQSRKAVADANASLRKNDIRGALNVVEEELKKYPENEVLKRASLQLTQLARLSERVHAMFAARRRGEAQMRVAFSAAENGSDKIITPDLKLFFDSYKADIEKLVAEGKQGTRDRERSAEREKLQAKIDEENLQNENSAFDSEVEKLIAEGEKASKEAVDRPAVNGK